MPEIKTTNRLSPIHGASPVETRTGFPLIARGFIIYLEIGTGGIFARTLYKDYDATISDQAAFEKAVIAAANTLPRLPKGGEFPRAVWDNQITSINFGWTPCHVTYILNVPFAEFVDHDPRQPDIQPVVFRDDKVVIDDLGVATTPNYQKNYSFFNLTIDSVNGASVLRMDNLMLINATGTPLGPEPSNPHARKLEYCMDILIRFNQMRLTQIVQSLTTGKQADENESLEGHFVIEPEFLKSVIIVFDPPQDNGGGSGPPK